MRFTSVCLVYSWNIWPPRSPQEMVCSQSRSMQCNTGGLWAFTQARLRQIRPLSGHMKEGQRSAVSAGIWLAPPLLHAGRLGLWASVNDESPNATDDAADEIMERIVKSATQGPSQRTQPRERKRSRANRKSRESPARGKTVRAWRRHRFCTVCAHSFCWVNSF